MRLNAIRALLALAFLGLYARAQISAPGPQAAPAVDSAALAIATDANPSMYASVTAGSQPVGTATPAVAAAPEGGVSAWAVTPSDTQASGGGLWNPQRLLESAVGLAFLVLVFFFIINSTRQTFESWEVEKSGEGGLKGQGGGPGDYGTLGDSFRESSGLYPVKMGGYSPISPAMPVGLRSKNSSGNLEYDEERGEGSVDPWDTQHQAQRASPPPSRVRHDAPASHRQQGQARVGGGDRQQGPTSRVPSGDRMQQQQQQQAPPSRVPSGGGGGSSSRSAAPQASSRSADPRASARGGPPQQPGQRGQYQPPPRHL